MKDSRKKGCPNENCVNHVRKTRYNHEQTVCPDCGTELVFVCKKCFKQIEDTGPKHKLCLACEAKRVEDRERRVGKAKVVGIKAAKVAGGTVVGIAAIAGGAVLMTVKKDVGAKLAEKGVDLVNKHLLKG